jgi:hypothetical protein
VNASGIARHSDKRGIMSTKKKVVLLATELIISGYIYILKQRNVLNYDCGMAHNTENFI